MVAISQRRVRVQDRRWVVGATFASSAILGLLAASIIPPDEDSQWLAIRLYEPKKPYVHESFSMNEIPSPYCSVLEVHPSGDVTVVRNSSEPIVNAPVLDFFKKRVRDAVEEYGSFERPFYFDLDTSDVPTCIGRMPREGESCQDVNTEAGCCSSGRPLVGISRNICCKCSLPLPIHGNQMPLALTKMIEFRDPYAWRDKKPLAVWHGSNTGHLEYAQFYARELNLKGVMYSTPRQKLVSIGQQRPDIIHASMEKHSWEELLEYKFIVTASGYAYAGLLKQALLSNSCVLRQDAVATEWYEPLLVPYVHFVPVKFDMSDLVEQVEWSITHDRECERIAQKGILFAKKHFQNISVNEFVHRAISGGIPLG